jgi:hypothetical protein
MHITVCFVVELVLHWNISKFQNTHRISQNINIPYSLLVFDVSVIVYLVGFPLCERYRCVDSIVYSACSEQGNYKESKIMKNWK